MPLSHPSRMRPANASVCRRPMAWATLSPATGSDALQSVLSAPNRALPHKHARRWTPTLLALHLQQCSGSPLTRATSGVTTQEPLASNSFPPLGQSEPQAGRVIPSSPCKRTGNLPAGLQRHEHRNGSVVEKRNQVGPGKDRATCYVSHNQRATISTSTPPLYADSLDVLLRVRRGVGLLRPTATLTLTRATLFHPRVASFPPRRPSALLQTSQGGFILFIVGVVHFR